MTPMPSPASTPVPPVPCEPESSPGDERFERLVAVHLPALSRVAYRRCRHRETAEEAVQETLIRAWRHLDRLRDPEAVRPWLFMILRNECARAFAKAPPAGVEIDPDAFAAAATDPDADFEAEALHRAVADLPERYREPLELFAFAGREVAEIADALGLERATVKTRLFRARARLRESLAETGLARAVTA